MLSIGMVLKDQYEILKVIGKGGMSTVYQARCLNDGKLLAVKDVARSGGNQNQVIEQSLSAEGRMLMQLSNPHLPRIYDIIETDTNIMLIMDFIEGESLDKVIARTGPQPMDQVLDWGMQICSVFDYLHNQPTPIIYRDMKPANVMLQSSGKIMLIDFGTARTEKVGVQMQEDTVCIGTAGFAAPEQFGGSGQSTAKTDIFCLGATLYNMVTGHSPCDPPKGILPLERWDPALKKSAIAQIIYKCTRNDPDERYQTAFELHEELRMVRMGMHKASLFGKSAKRGAEDWQKQELKRADVTGGLSGLLKWGGVKKQEPEKLASWQPQWEQPGDFEQRHPETNGYWQSQEAVEPVTGAEIQPDLIAEEIVYVQEQPVDNERAGRGKTLTLLSAVIAGVLAVLGIILLAAELTASASVLLICAVGAVILAIAGIVLSQTTD